MLTSLVILISLIVIWIVSHIFINVNKTRHRLYDLALRSDPQPATYNVRVESSTNYEPDTFNSYQLTRVTYRPPTQQELLLAQATVNDVFIVWVITVYDLNLVKAPPPQATYEIIVNGQTWIIERTTNTDLLQSWECFCRLSQGPTGSAP